MRERLNEEWRQVRGHVKYEILKWAVITAGGAMIGIGAYIAHRWLPHFPDWTPFVLAFILAVIAFGWLGSRLSNGSARPAAAPPASATPEPLTVAEDDPRVTFKIEDRVAPGGTNTMTPVTLTNHGGREALDVAIRSVDLRVGSASFPIVAAIASSKQETILPELRGPGGKPFLVTGDLTLLFEAEWESFNDPSIPIVQVAGQIRYRDYRDRSFSTDCLIIYTRKTGGIDVAQFTYRRLQ